MPSEKTYGEQFTPEVPLDYEPQVPLVDVRWGRDQGYVQIVTKALSAHGGRWAESDDTHVTDGFYVDLNRQAINKLIRDLRRARDQAFGRDE